MPSKPLPGSESLSKDRFKGLTHKGSDLLFVGLEISSVGDLTENGPRPDRPTKRLFRLWV